MCGQGWRGAHREEVVVHAVPIERRPLGLAEDSLEELAHVVVNVFQRNHEPLEQHPVEVVHANAPLVLEFQQCAVHRPRVVCGLLRTRLHDQEIELARHPLRCLVLLRQTRRRHCVSVQTRR